MYGLITQDLNLSYLTLYQLLSAIVCMALRPLIRNMDFTFLSAISEKLLFYSGVGVHISDSSFPCLHSSYCCVKHMGTYLVAKGSSVRLTMIYGETHTHRTLHKPGKKQIQFVLSRSPMKKYQEKQKEFLGEKLYHKYFSYLDINNKRNCSLKHDDYKLNKKLVLFL